MNISAEAVKQLRERTSAGMMECKRALVESEGNLDAAAELLRKQGIAKADKKSARIAAEGVIALQASADGRKAAIVEVNSETDFVSRGDAFNEFANAVAKLALETEPADLDALLAAKLPSGESVDERRRTLIAKIGENLSVRRFVVLRSAGFLGTYLHGTRIASLVAVEGGEASLARDLAMHVAASNPRYLAASDVPADEVAKERSILTDQAAQDPKNAGKPAQVMAQIAEGKLRKSLSEITFMGQPFVKDDKQSIEKLLKGANARVTRFERFEVGAGIEKKQEDFVAEVMKQAGQDDSSKKGNEPSKH